MIALLLFIYFSVSLSWGGGLPTETNAIFYEKLDQTGYKIQYIDRPVGWSNLGALFENKGRFKNRPPQLLCVFGAWLIYPTQAYQKTQSESVTFLAGNGTCLPTDEIKRIRSMQPLTPLKIESVESVVTFPRETLKGTARIINSYNQTSSHFGDAVGGEGVESLVLIGDKPWSLINMNGGIMCLRPPPGDPMSVCYMNKIMHVKDFDVRYIYTGCPDENEKSIITNVKMTECIKLTTETAVPLRNTAFNLTGRSMVTGSSRPLECQNISWTGGNVTEEQTSIIKTLLTVRLTHDFHNTEQMLWPDASEDVWKTGPLDTAFDIVIATVPPEIINTYYLKVIREFTVYHLNEIWKEERASKSDSGPADLRTWRFHKVINFLLNKCLRKASLPDYVKQARQNIQEQYNRNPKVEDFMSKILAEFSFNATIDPVIDMTYLVANYVFGMCHHVFEYKFNFWDSYITSFTHLYFHPLAERWTNPKISQKAYGIILSGFGVKSQHVRLAFATTVINQLNPNFEPFPRCC